jgi:hypothetical protein
VRLQAFYAVQIQAYHVVYLQADCAESLAARRAGSWRSGGPSGNVPEHFEQKLLFS